ncbi:MAG: hypothetical protein JW748_05420 [Anaerolineales bacterium]|nr:hypothetical protein [Anaerolineales bacterium]
MPLTDKCPFCGSYNDVEAAVCYFCHKDLPDTPGHKKKRGPKPEQNASIRLPPSYVVKRKSPPGCLVSLVTVIFLTCLFVVFQAVNGIYKFFTWEIPFPPTDAGRYLAYFLSGLLSYIDTLLKFPIIVAASVVMLLILCYGLLNLKRWSRVLALMLLVILLLALFWSFATFVMHFVSNPVNNIGFLLLLFGIILNIYALVWFFEHKKMFE